MPNVLIVGNVTKDVYLRLDSERNQFEHDDNDIPWLDLAFDGNQHDYYSRISIYGGASISLEVLSRFGLKSNISGTPATFLDGQFIANDVHTSYRYILCKGDNTTRFTPSEPMHTVWEAPTTTPDWIYIDSSAYITAKLAGNIASYLDVSRKVKLAFFVNKHTNPKTPHVAELLKRAEIIISDKKLKTAKKHINITNKDISLDNLSVEWTLSNRHDLMTQFSSHLTIAATALAAIILDKKPEEALLLARANAQKSRLGSTSNLTTLEKLITDDYYRIKTNQQEQTMPEIEETAKKLMTAGKGILAADESGGSIHKKFESMNIPDDEQHRRDYRNIFFTTPDLEKYASGVILFDETARQKADNGQTFTEFLRDRGVIPGIKVDQGLVNYEDSDEKYTQGLEGLPERLAEYYQMGARFAKWRAAFEVTDHSPSDRAIKDNADILANYAKDCQNANIVPIVEPELVYDGDYTIEQNIEITSKILDQLFKSLAEKEINLAGCILKVNMVLAGKRRAVQSTPAEVGAATAKVLKEHVPEALAGVVFLSGGQSVEQATNNLQAVTNNGPFPWTVTFSFARALQDPALQAWQGDNANCDAARIAFRERLIANAQALTPQIDKQ